MMKREDLKPHLVANHHHDHGAANPDINLVDAACLIASSLDRIADALDRLGNNRSVTQAGTELGAIEAFGMHIGEKLDMLVSAVGEVSHERS
jgi:hypothetical protein